mgnify:CR=1 FL=1
MAIDSIDKLEIEQKSPRKGNDKELFTYDKSLESIIQRKYERHLRPSEAFKLIIDSLENSNSQYQQIKEDMFSSLHGEWLSLAMLRKDKETLICYLDPENLVLDNNKTNYIIQGSSLKHSGEKTFNIKVIESQNCADLNKLPKDLVEFLYSRKYEDLPQVMKKGNIRAQLLLPQEGIIRPVGREGRYYNFDISVDSNDRAGRGVRERR